MTMMNYLLVFISLLMGNMLNLIASYLPYLMEKNWREQCYYFLHIEQKLPDRRKIFSCQHCHAPFSLWHLLPLYRAIILRETCKNCHHTFPTRYLVVEIITSVISTMIIYYSNVSWELGLNLILAWGLIVLTIIDYEHFLLPDSITFSLIWLGLIANTFNFFTSSELAIWGAICGYMTLFLIAKIFKHLRGIEGLGEGDCKLFAIFGAWWGIHVLMPILLIASLTGSIVGMIKILQKKQTMETYISFGPYLAGAGILTIFSHIVK